MKFRIQVTSGGEVKFAGESQQERPIYYGAPPETGLWRVSVPKLEDFLARELAPQTFGCSIEEFRFGFELAELDEWGERFTTTHGYMNYRPKTKTFIAVGQLEWKEVKDLTAPEQLSRLSDALLSAIERIATAKRKPKDFDYAALAQAVRSILLSCEPLFVEVNA